MANKRTLGVDLSTHDMTPDVKVTSTDIKRALADKHYKDFFMTEVKSGPTYLHATGGLRILDGACN